MEILLIWFYLTGAFATWLAIMYLENDDVNFRKTAIYIIVWPLTMAVVAFLGLLTALILGVAAYGQQRSMRNRKKVS